MLCKPCLQGDAVPNDQAAAAGIYNYCACLGLDNGDYGGYVPAGKLGGSMGAPAELLQCTFNAVVTQTSETHHFMGMEMVLYVGQWGRWRMESEEDIAEYHCFIDVDLGGKKCRSEELRRERNPGFY